MVRALRVGARALALGGVLLALLAVRAVTASRGELARGDALVARGDLDSAILAYRRSARWYAPGNPYCVRALDGLEEIARTTEDPAQAIAAWRAVRGSILATRSFYTPNQERLDRAERAIAEATAALASAEDRDATRRTTLERLQAPERPVLGWTLVLLAGWLAWTGGAFAFAQRAIDEEDRVRGMSARVWGTIVLVGFGLFVLGMALA